MYSILMNYYYRLLLLPINCYLFNKSIIKITIITNYRLTNQAGTYPLNSYILKSKVKNKNIANEQTSTLTGVILSIPQC